MSVHDKIVRLEQISADDLGGEHTEDSLKYVQSAPALYGQEDDILRVPDDTELQQCESTESELLAVVPSVPGVPADWPQIPQLFERHSWNFSTAVSPSINKAVGHLELLQTVIEEWLEEKESIRAESKKSKRSQHSSRPVSRKQLHFQDGARSDSKQLSIHGVGALGDAGSKELVSISEDVVSDFPYLGAEEVVEETVTLLAKLETDRQDTLAKLAAERDRVKSLGVKIDKLAEKRLLDLPAAVQKEHEACAHNITQLNWNVAYKQKNKTQLMTRVAVASALNKKLKGDVEFIHSHIPLVSEKLELEQDAMRRIENAQDETNDELRITEEHHQAVLDKSAELHQLAEKERTAMKKDLDGVRQDLKNINTDFEDAKKQMLTLSGSCDYCERKLKSDDEELKVLLVKEENAKTKEALHSTTLKDLKEQIVAAEYEHGKHTKFIGELSREKSTKFEANKTLRAKLEMEIVGKTESHRKLSRSNKEMKIDIEDMEQKIKECTKKIQRLRARYFGPESESEPDGIGGKKQKEKDEKNMVRMQREMERTEKLMEVTEDDLGQVQILNATLKEQLRIEEDKCCATEEELRSTAEALKKQVKDEVHNRSVLVARINSDTNESERFEVEVNEKMVKANKKWDEVQSAVQKVLAKVEKYRKEVEVRQKVMRDIQQKVNDLKEAHEMMDKVKSEEIIALTPIHEELKLVMTNLDKKLQHMMKKTEMMVSKMEDMSAAAAMMEKSFKNTSRQVDNLMELQEELNIQMETNRKMDDEVVASVDDITARINHRAKVHRELMRERHQVYDEQEAELWELLKLNEALAKRYRALQSEYILLKNHLLNTYSGKVLNENAIRDIRQLQSLQKRMQAAMLEYFKYRGLYNQAELSRLESDSNHNGVCVGKIKTSMDSCLNKIAEFLLNQFNADSIHKMAMDKVAEDEALEKAKAAQQTQLIAG